jgi:hypothetical protein
MILVCLAFCLVWWCSCVLIFLPLVYHPAWSVVYVAWLYFLLSDVFRALMIALFVLALAITARFMPPSLIALALLAIVASCEN